jgi:hypothetical protein
MEKRDEYRLLVSKPEEKRLPGRRRCCWVELGNVGWMDGY